MLSFQTLSTIESLLMSKAHPVWGEFMLLAQVIQEVQQEKAVVTAASRVQPSTRNMPIETVPAALESYTAATEAIDKGA